MERREKDKLIDEIAEYIEKYRYAESMTSHRLARKAICAALGDDNHTKGKCGLVTMSTPVRLDVVNGKFRITIKERSLSWNEEYIDTKDIEVLKTFIEDVYKEGFTDGSQTSMNKGTWKEQ